MFGVIQQKYKKVEKELPIVNPTVVYYLLEDNAEDYEIVFREIKIGEERLYLPCLKRKS